MDFPVGWVLFSNYMQKHTFHDHNMKHILFSFSELFFSPNNKDAYCSRVPCQVAQQDISKLWYDWTVIVQSVTQCNSLVSCHFKISPRYDSTYLISFAPGDCSSKQFGLSPNVMTEWPPILRISSNYNSTNSKSSVFQETWTVYKSLPDITLVTQRPLFQEIWTINFLPGVSNKWLIISRLFLL